MVSYWAAAFLASAAFVHVDPPTNRSRTLAEDPCSAVADVVDRQVSAGQRER